MLRNMKFNPDNWSTINGSEVTDGCWSKDGKIGVHINGSLMEPISYKPGQDLRDMLIVYVKEFQKRDSKKIGALENITIAKLNSCKDILEDSYTDEQKLEMRKSKLVRILKDDYEK